MGTCFFEHKANILFWSHSGRLCCLFGGAYYKKITPRCHRLAKKKSVKQQYLLTEVSVPNHIQNNVLTDHDIEHEIIVFDGGNSNSPPIQPPDDVHWQCISVLEAKFIMAMDETDP